MLRLALTLGVGELLELLLGHRQHRLRGALQLRLGRVAALGRQGGPGGLLLGGAGYTKEWPVERLVRDAKLYDIGAGTNEIRRFLIGRELLGA